MNEITQDAPDIVDVVKIDGEEYMRYKPIPLDYCIIRGTYVDENGNLSTEEEAMQLEVLSAVFCLQKVRRKGNCTGKIQSGSRKYPLQKVTVPGIFY